MSYRSATAENHLFYSIFYWCQKCMSANKNLYRVMINETIRNIREIYLRTILLWYVDYLVYNLLFLLHGDRCAVDKLYFYFVSFKSVNKYDIITRTLNFGLFKQFGFIKSPVGRFYLKLV